MSNAQSSTRIYTSYSGISGYQPSKKMKNSHFGSSALPILITPSLNRFMSLGLASLRVLGLGKIIISVGT